MGFASPLSRLRSTHGYAPGAAYAALLCGGKNIAVGKVSASDAIETHG
ncbi:MAG: hypothetical protein IKP00_17255 [Victivallales bacterium]|nr:hypothetical protein [Victivallales bacterium]